MLICLGQGIWPLKPIFLIGLTWSGTLAGRIWILHAETLSLNRYKTSQKVLLYMCQPNVGTTVTTCACTAVLQLWDPWQALLGLMKIRQTALPSPPAATIHYHDNHRSWMQKFIPTRFPPLYSILWKFNGFLLIFTSLNSLPIVPAVNLLPKSLCYILRVMITMEKLKTNCSNREQHECTNKKIKNFCLYSFRFQ